LLYFLESTGTALDRDSGKSTKCHAPSHKATLHTTACDQEYWILYDLQTIGYGFPSRSSIIKGMDRDAEGCLGRAGLEGFIT
jgi:hypothetical protein